MNTKNLLVSLLAIVSVLFLATMASAITTDAYQIGVAIDNAPISETSIIAGDTIQIQIWMKPLFDVGFDRDVTVEVELDTGKQEVRAISEPMVIEAGQGWKKVTLNIKVPYELKDDLSHNATLTVEIDGKEYSYIESFIINVKRAAYNIDVKSVTVAQSVEAGEIFPVDVVLKNTGYLDLEDVYVTARIPALNVEQTVYFGDMVSLECSGSSCDDDDEDDSASGRLMLKIPYNAEAGVYTLEIEVSNDDSASTVVKQIVVKNEFSKNVIVSSYAKSIAVGENAEYELLIVNPTDKVKVYRLVLSEDSGLTTAGESIVAVSAGSSKAVKVTASADTEGEYNFDVNIFSGEDLVETVTLSLEAEGKAIADLTVVLTIILAIIFIVLLVVLIVLIGKKPAKTEEFGESYY